MLPLIDVPNPRFQMPEFSVAQLRHSRHYASVLSDASSLYKRGGKHVTEALELLEMNIGNIRNGQSWSEAHYCEHEAALICSRYADAGGYLLRLRFHPRDRIRWLEAAVAAASQLQDKRAEGVHIGNLASAYTNVGETEKALALFKQRLELAAEAGDSDADERISGNLASVHLMLRENEKAIELLEARLAFTQRRKDPRGEGHALGNLGVAYGRIGDFARALEFHERNLALSRKIEDIKGESAALANQAIIYRKLRDPQRALEIHNSSLILIRRIGDRRAEGHSLFNISLALKDLGRVSEALNHAVNALKILSEEDDPNATMVRKTVDRWKQRGF